MAENFNRSWHGENYRVSKPPLVQRCSLPTNTKPLGRPPLKSRTSFHFQEALKEESETSKVSKRTLTRLPSKQGSLNRKANFTSRPHLPRRVTCQSILSDPDLISRVNLTGRTTFSYTPKCKVCQDTSFLYFYFCPPCIHSYLSTKTNKQLKDIWWTFICCVRAWLNSCVIW